MEKLDVIEHVSDDLTKSRFTQFEILLFISDTTTTSFTDAASRLSPTRMSDPGQGQDLDPSPGPGLDPVAALGADPGTRRMTGGIDPDLSRGRGPSPGPNLGRGLDLLRRTRLPGAGRGLDPTPGMHLPMLISMLPWADFVMVQLRMSRI